MNRLDATLSSIIAPDENTRQQANKRLDQLAIPHWALGRLLDLALDLAAMTGSMCPRTSRRTVVTMAGDHGVVDEGVSKFPREVTPQMVANFVRDRASINMLARHADAAVVVVDMGVAADLSALARAGKIINKKIAAGTANMARGSAMTREQAIASLEAGIDVAADLADTTDLFGVGDMGIGNTTPSTAICAVLTGEDVASVCGRGTGLDDAQLGHKIEVINRSIAVNRPDPTNGLDVLAKVGGFEIGGIAGVILGAAARRRPVIIDGLIATAGAMIAHCLAPLCRHYMIASHRSVEQGHRAMHRHLGLEPLLDLNLRLGEGTGAALAMHIVHAAARTLDEIDTFDEAMVSQAVLP